jgi:Rod binding domain-containing protein
MSDATAVSSLPVSLLTSPRAPSLNAADRSSPAKISKTAKDFEASFLSIMMGSMFEGISTAPPFGGGAGEEAFRSFYTDAIAKSVVRHGGIGLAKQIEAEMLKMQGVKPTEPASGTPSASQNAASNNPAALSAAATALSTKKALSSYQGTVQ